MTVFVILNRRGSRLKRPFPLLHWGSLPLSFTPKFYSGFLTLTIPFYTYKRFRSITHKSCKLYKVFNFCYLN